MACIYRHASENKTHAEKGAHSEEKKNTPYKGNCPPEKNARHQNEIVR
jgi:hypothetical protein